uniref:Uncharacterized protein n=1 Tax=Glossina pallidipes TaxID=7398 RepID=A0A1A9ZGS6_GLOPL
MYANNSLEIKILVANGHFDLACKLCLLHALAIMLSLYHNDDHHNDFGVVGTQYLIANSCKLSTKGHRYRQPQQQHVPLAALRIITTTATTCKSLYSGARLCWPED